MSSSSTPSLSLSFSDVQAAAERVKGHVHRTPVLTCSRLDALSGHTLFFKCELFQKAGSFKVSHDHTLQYIYICSVSSLLIIHTEC